MYKLESFNNPARNIFMKAGRAYTQLYLNQKVREYTSYEKSGERTVKYYLNKIGRDPYLETSVLVKGISGLPWDLYDVSAQREPRDKKS